MSEDFRDNKKSSFLVAEDLHKTYNPKTEPLAVLSGANINIREGEIVGIIGASGAGKSTLLHILGGLDRPGRGNVRFRDQDIYTARNGFLETYRNHHVGFVFQNFNLMSDFSAIENTMFPALIRGADKTEARERAEKLLRRVGLESRLRHRPAELSGGESQRVALARALVNNPDILFADEPTGNLDAHSSESLMDLICELNREFRKSFVIVTHSHKIARRMNTVYELADGKIRPAADREVLI